MRRLATYHMPDCFRVVINALTHCLFVQRIPQGYSIILRTAFPSSISRGWQSNLAWGNVAKRCLRRTYTESVLTTLPDLIPLSEFDVSSSLDVSTHIYHVSNMHATVRDFAIAACPLVMVTFAGPPWASHSRNLIRGCHGVEEDVAAIQPGPHYRQKPSCRL